MSISKVLRLGLLLFTLFINDNNSLIISEKSVNSPEFINLNVPSLIINPLLEWMKRRTTTIRPTLPANRFCGSCSCGISGGKNKIVGGTETALNQYPWMAMLIYFNQFYCGGSLINDRYILTAAHCVRGFVARRISVRLLIHERTVQNSGMIERKVKYATIHNRYNSKNFYNDIALLLLDQTVPIDINPLLKPICLPNADETLLRSYDDIKGTVIGWGALNENGPLSNNLQEVEVPIINGTDCMKLLPINQNMICAGYAEGKRDSCQGDSGGPLMLSEGNVYKQIGIVSWGYGCALPNKPGVYSSVQNYMSWIKTNTKDACYCN